MPKIKRALLSVADKTNLIPLAESLRKTGCELVSTGGTFKALSQAGIPVREISEVTKNPEAFGGRVKTLSFQTSSGILFDREKDREEADSLGVEQIDMVICNFYPFEKAQKDHADLPTLIENIDIGGPTMVRSAAKNYKHVAVVTDPADYSALIVELNQEEGALSEETRRRLMCKAFNYTADYDAMISMAMDSENGTQSLRLAFTEGKSLRYGENSHQKALFYKERGAEGALYDMRVLNGKELSFNNLTDMNSAIDAVKDLKQQACAVIKHSTPCGLAEGANQLESLSLAWQGDPVSAFGSVIAFNTCLEEETVKFFHLDDPDRSKRKFVEVIIAPQVTVKALRILQKHKNLRVVECALPTMDLSYDLRYFKGSLLRQEQDAQLLNEAQCVTEKGDKHLDCTLMTFGLKAVCHVKSNAIVIVRKRENGTHQLLGMGAGQPNRLTSVALAVEKCRLNLEEEYSGTSAGLELYIHEQLSQSILVSEAFFPFSDSIDVCAKHGIKNVLQPGGSIRDQDVIDAANKHEMVMVFTGLRHFKH
ncbi:Bifunctional purine biosynthesis protein PurH [Chlamydiales bacterium SCGC AG-110-M15]|nr:Bifunctional purine biosynthesis protein PurH [Chlamydiales bacterium SCGC AG-110-M15]